jgi:hypothetical protein
MDALMLNLSLTPRFNAVNCEQENEKPFKRFLREARLDTPLKQGVNEKRFSAKQCVNSKDLT